MLHSSSSSYHPLYSHLPQTPLSHTLVQDRSIFHEVQLTTNEDTIEPNGWIFYNIYEYQSCIGGALLIESFGYATGVCYTTLTSDGHGSHNKGSFIYVCQADNTAAYIDTFSDDECKNFAGSVDLVLGCEPPRYSYLSCRTSVHLPSYYGFTYSYLTASPTSSSTCQTPFIYHSMINDYCFQLAYSNLTIQMNYPRISYFNSPNGTCNPAQKVRDISLQDIDDHCVLQSHATGVASPAGYFQPIFQPNASEYYYYYNYEYSYEVERNLNFSEFYVTASASTDFNMNTSNSYGWIINTIYNTSTCLSPQDVSASYYYYYYYYGTTNNSSMNGTLYIPLQINGIATGECFNIFDQQNLTINSYFYLCNNESIVYRVNFVGIGCDPFNQISVQEVIQPQCYANYSQILSCRNFVVDDDTIALTQIPTDIPMNYVVNIASYDNFCGQPVSFAVYADDFCFVDQPNNISYQFQYPFELIYSSPYSSSDFCNQKKLIGNSSFDGRCRPLSIKYSQDPFQAPLPSNYYASYYYGVTNFTLYTSTYLMAVYSDDYVAVSSNGDRIKQKIALLKRNTILIGSLLGGGGLILLLAYVLYVNWKGVYNRLPLASANYEMTQTNAVYDTESGIELHHRSDLD